MLKADEKRDKTEKCLFCPFFNHLNGELHFFDNFHLSHLDGFVSITAPH